MNTPTGLFYSQDHEWVKVEGSTAYVGITDFAQDALGDVVFVEAPEMDATVTAGEVFGTVESIKAVSDMTSPVSGTVVAVNEALADAPESVNSDPYGSWIMQVELSDASEVEGLMDADAYVAFCATCEH